MASTQSASDTAPPTSPPAVATTPPAPPPPAATTPPSPPPPADTTPSTPPSPAVAKATAETAVPVVASTPAPATVVEHVHEAETLPTRWENGLCSQCCGGDFRTCLGAWFCPCFLYGRTAQRMQHFPEHFSNTQKPEYCEANCWTYYCVNYAVGLPWLLVMWKRGQMRRAFGIQGTSCGDCSASFWCTCCAEAQMETEIKRRAARAQREKATQYVRPQETMHYQPVPPRPATILPPAPAPTQQETGQLPAPAPASPLPATEKA